MTFYPIQKLIPESNIVLFSPHYDDVLLGLGGYILALKNLGLLPYKKFHILLLFSRSNYLAGSGAGNYDTSLERIKLATGRRLLEDMNCLDELLGVHTYRYELLGERECMLRSKVFAEGDMEFPHGMYEQFSAEDWQIFTRLQHLVSSWGGNKDTALVFPLAIKEHIDHFITREAGINAAKEPGSDFKAQMYFQEDKPYAGIQTPEEAARIEAFTRSYRLEARLYPIQPEKIVEMAFKHYLSQVEEVYRHGVLERAEQLQTMYNLDRPCDCIYRLPAAASPEERMSNIP
jgi:hypothetical protein